MIYNAARQRVSEYIDGPSVCPDCGGDLIARRGEFVIWHWAHRPKPGMTRDSCGVETQWHLRMKEAHRRQGWEIEFSVTSDKKPLFRFDAVNFKAGKVREFIHSLTPKYVAKHQRLNATLRPGTVEWIFDGDHFASARMKRRVDQRGRHYIKRFLKPAASQIHDQIGGLVYYDNQLWQHWTNDVWYPHKFTDPAIGTFNTLVA